MKRQIIKTKPVQPYRIARIVIVIIVAAVLAALAYYELRTRTAVRQDSAIFFRNTQSPAIPT